MTWTSRSARGGRFGPKVMVNGAHDVYVERKGRVRGHRGNGPESTPEPLRQDVRRSMKPAAHCEGRPITDMDVGRGPGLIAT